MSRSQTDRKAEPRTQGDLFQDFDSVAHGIGGRIGAGIFSRVESFPKREELLARQSGRMDSLPEDILWDGLGEESAPIFVVYKLVHEAFSNAPHFFRTALVEFMRAQPDRFSTVFNRETLWSAMAALPTEAAFPKCPSVDEIRVILVKAQRRGIWWRSDEELLREAESVHGALTSRDGTFCKGLAALKALQKQKAKGIVAGNLLLQVPGRLAAYAEEVVALGGKKKLPSLEELRGRVDEFARDRELDVRHENIPIDLLYTCPDDDLLHVRLLVRAKANASERAEVRRRSLYLRYFVRKAFPSFSPEKLDIRLALYLDHGRTQAGWKDADQLFHPDEWLDRMRFWNEICPGVAPEDLFATIRRSAAKALSDQNVVEKLKVHFNRSSTKGRPEIRQGSSS
jgi:hypothetical protein